jgi:gamma-glutamylcyclotransferase (GGCT)/AIG2-like uncharacterized protein YtfP
MRIAEIISGIDRPKPIYYFSYGMLCDPDNMNHRGSQMIGRATLPNYKLELLSHANIVPAPGKMYGTLWAINSKILEQLDMVEGYPDYYTRITKEVECNNKQYSAQIYVMTQSSRNYSLDRVPAIRYLNLIERGYQHAGIPLEQLDRAISDARARLEELKKS